MPSPVHPFDEPLRLHVADRALDGGDVAVLVLRRDDGARLPAWSAGAHIAVRFGPNHYVREYSLCGSPKDDATWTIAVRLADAGRGGSRFIHEYLHEGQTVDVVHIANLFRYSATPRPRFIVGGIGLTPVLPMIESAECEGHDWRLLYIGRRRAAMPFLARLERFGQRVRIVESAVDGRPDIASYLAEEPASHIYSCGPESLLKAVETAARGEGLPATVERFRPQTTDDSLVNTAFEVIIDSTGQRIPVRSDQTTLQALLAAGVDVMNSCREGTCGSCEAPVVEGVPDHRDSILTDDEQEAGDYMFVCVSRALTPTLTLGL